MANVDPGREQVWQTARAFAYDDFLAAILSPPEARDDLVTLAAFHAEIRRIPREVSEAPLGEIKLRWWRDEIEAAQRSGHPVGDAVKSVMSRRGVPKDLLLTEIEAAAHFLYAAPFGTQQDLDRHVAARESARADTKLRILGGVDREGQSWLADAGLVIGLTDNLVHLPEFMAHGRWPLASEGLPDTGSTGVQQVAAKRLIGAEIERIRQIKASVGRNFATVSKSWRLAVLGIALSEPYLRALERSGYDPLRDECEIAPLARVWKLWRAGRYGVV